MLILGHSRGTPADMQRRADYDDVLLDVVSELEQSVSRAEAAGIPRERLVADPGIGFAKRAEQSTQLLAHCGWLRDRLRRRHRASTRHRLLKMEARIPGATLAWFRCLAGSIL